MITLWFGLQAAAFVVLVAGWASLRVAPASAVGPIRCLLLALPLAVVGALWPTSAPNYTPAAQVYAPAMAGGTPLIGVGVAEGAEVPVPAPVVPALLLLVGVVPAVWSALGLRTLLRDAEPLHRIRGVEVWIAPRATAPFAVWLLRPVIVLDPDTAFDAALALVAFRHEAQHHRHRDPLVAWLLWAVGFAAPAALLLRSPMARAEEIAVDQALLSRGEPALAYARALATVAGRPHGRLHWSPLAAGMAAFLPRRISMLFSPPRPRPLQTAAIVLLALGVAPVAGWAGSGVIVDRAPDPARTAAAADRLALDGFPGARCAAVREALTHLVATRNGRAWAMAAGDRATEELPWVEAQLALAGLPRELAAVPFVESGWRNRAESELPDSVPVSSRGAGYWMFIAPTARAWGLVVDGGRDDRNDKALETGAALRLLSADYDRFGSWPLALAAYNQGEQAVEVAIRDGGTRDALALANAKLLNGYVAQVYAAALLLTDPALLQ